MPREKIKFALWMKPETHLLVRDVSPKDNCKNQSEFIEKAIHFYAGYVAANSSLDYLAPTLSSALTGITHDSENRIARLLFKLTVELSMMMHVIADGLEVDERRLDDLRAKCIREIRGTSGSISFDKMVHHYPNGGT